MTLPDGATKERLTDVLLSAFNELRKQSESSDSYVFYRARASARKRAQSSPARIAGKGKVHKAVTFPGTNFVQEKVQDFTQSTCVMRKKRVY